MASDYSYSSTELSGQVTKSIKDVSHHITSSAGGWPNYKVGMLCSYDFTIQDGLPKLYEFNTNIACMYDAPLTPKVNALSSYLSSQSVDTLHVIGIKYGDNLSNPSEAFYNQLSSSCAQHNISSSLILETDPIGDNPDLSPEHSIQSGSNVYTLFVHSPYRYTEFNSLASGSYSKKEFRNILSNSPSSSLLIGEFDPSSCVPNNDYPDYIMKIDDGDTTLLNGSCRFYSFESSHFALLSASFDLNQYYGQTPMYEKYIIGSGSDAGEGKYNYEYTYSLLHSHDGLVDLGCESVSHKLIPSSSGDDKRWDIVSSLEYRHVIPTGSQIEMTDGSKKEIGALQVGDYVKSLKITNLDFESNDYRTWSSTSVSGSINGSKVTRIISSKIPAHYVVNNKYTLPDNVSRIMCRPDKSDYKFDIISELSTSSQLVRKIDGNDFEPLNITSLEYKLEDKVFFAVEVDGNDIFYMDDGLVVHS